MVNFIYFYFSFSYLFYFLDLGLEFSMMLYMIVTHWSHVTVTNHGHTIMCYKKDIEGFRTVMVYYISFRID